MTRRLRRARGVIPHLIRIPNLTLCCILALSLVTTGQQVSQLPAPSGDHGVGRNSLFWVDSSRSDRPMRVDFWYPAERSPIARPPSRYYPPVDALSRNATANRALAERFGTVLGDIRQGNVLSNSHDAVPIASAGRPFPVLLFSHGLGHSPFDYAIQLEDLASHGYVVVGVEHPGDSFGVALSDGSVIPYDTELWQKYPVDSAGEQGSFYESRASLHAADLVFALNGLDALSNDSKSPFRGALDLSRVGAFGHSSGGRAATASCLIESRIKACLNEDGLLRWPIAGLPFRGSFAKLDWFDPGFDEQDYAGLRTTAVDYAKANLQATGAALDTFRAPEGGSYHFTLLHRGMRHTAFTDLRWLTSSSPAERTRQEQYLDSVRQIVVAFFDHTLNRTAQSPICETSIQSVLVQCYSPAK